MRPSDWVTAMSSMVIKVSLRRATLNGSLPSSFIFADAASNALANVGDF